MKTKNELSRGKKLRLKKIVIVGLTSNQAEFIKGGGVIKGNPPNPPIPPPKPDPVPVPIPGPEKPGTVASRVPDGECTVMGGGLGG
ncbi:hypothetical protein [Pedobacter sp. GR22-10]|uniref:hypothetical protein n=1 Tax=Pedobacter sp. GR22-10 TaxID=2994472 RepID=UPI00224577E6|nr:hypothetical protein [Pedobacter sp. GR22-10]MCX2429855.1 hypothetical protein [Pedobacter sp. GR22-10]